MQLELKELQKTMESIEFEDLVASRLNVLDEEFGSISDRFHINHVAYTPLPHHPEGLPPTPLHAAYGYSLSVELPDDSFRHFLALGYSIHTPLKETAIPVHYLLLSPTHTRIGREDILGQLNPYATRILEAQRLLYPEFASRAKKMLNRRYGAEDRPYSGSHTTTQEIVAQLTQSPEYTNQTYGLGTSTLGDRVQAEIALDTFLVDILSSSKII